ncbi:MAG: RNA-binding domain-containing protein, partial [Pseudomonadota bacterium]
MLSETELKNLILNMESDRIERTESEKNTDKFAQAICAFANDLAGHRLPGYLLIGVKDNGEISGLKVTDELLKELGAIRSNGNVLPQPVMNVAKFTFDKGDIALVEVFPSDLPPVRYKGRVHIRIGPRKAIANEQEEKLLTEKRVSFAKSFDATPCLGSTLNDLNLALFAAYRTKVIDEETIAANHRSIEEQLSSLRLFNPERQCPSHAGILIFGKNPKYFLPGAYIQYLKFPANNFEDIPIDQ